MYITAHDKTLGSYLEFGVFSGSSFNFAMKVNKRIILQDSFLKLAQDKNLVKLLDAGTDSRWDLQQRVWEKKIHPSALISFDENNEMLFEERFNQRIYLFDCCFVLTSPRSVN